MGKYENDIGFDRFKAALQKTGGNLTRTAELLGIDRTHLTTYASEHPDWKQAIKDSRMGLFDECMVSARVLAIGIPDRDEKGTFIGWRERPDGNMLRYLISTLGRDEGFGEQKDAPATDKGIDRININVTYNKKEDLGPQEKSLNSNSQS